MSLLIFIDTNIFLDFYRQPGESAKRQLDALERHKDRLIIGDQVRMEFLKNRQKVILKSISEIKTPEFPKMPQVLAEAKSAKALVTSTKKSKEHTKTLKLRAEKILREPSRYDPVFKTFSRIFDFNSEYNLRRPKKERFTVRNLARKRFALGYPPRKPGDTSFGDAVNWEWIVQCAVKSNDNSDILIVSRDGDFGGQLNGNSYLNDWLKREFKDRVSRKRKIELTAKLTDALKRLDENVEAEDERAEEEVINASLPSSDIRPDLSWLDRYLASLSPQERAEWDVSMTKALEGLI